MAYVYILYSKTLHSHYVGSCKNLENRLFEHNNSTFENSYTSKAKDWVFILKIENLGYQQARDIEKHIKRMKSKIFIENLKKYPELVEKLKTRYS
ncbi:MAG: endonuclease [Bacteroidetes bacterium HGW-Bacteroidetes-18]|nr:MAG: endonuclease [Bacteroidetes bacterium HGW-Bacteroidetes-18]